MTSEAAIQQQIRLAAAHVGCYLWRNNVGACINDQGRMLRYGLANDSKKLSDAIKSSDLIGIGPGGRFLALEIKAPGWKRPTDSHERAQQNFIDLVRRTGGLAGFSTSVEDALMVIHGQT